MDTLPQAFQTIWTPFGSGYVSALHCDEASRKLPPPDKHVEGIKILKVLRAALSLR